MYTALCKSFQVTDPSLRAGDYILCQMELATSFDETQHWYPQLGPVSEARREKLRAVCFGNFAKNLKCQVCVWGGWGGGSYLWLYQLTTWCSLLSSCQPLIASFFWS